ncbi:MAG: hypothetical protein KKF44_03270 [Nanoarchaeota archaeon]|nr:hypothetical protein [Nanoarchaeota archaeon]
MIGNFILKKPGQKLIKLRLEYEDNLIKNIQIKGDFFMYPEEGIEDLEKELIGKEIDTKELIAFIDEFFEKNDVTPYGISSEGIAEAIVGCLE